MKVLLNSRAFYPMMGGLEVITEQLAEEWAVRGHEVRIWTQAPLGDAPELTTLSVARSPSLREALRLVAWSDIVVYSGITLRDLLPAFFPRQRPVVFIHHGMMEYREGFSRLLVDLKRIASRLGTNIAVSQAVARTVPGGARVIPNAYRSGFESIIRAPKMLLYVGRLVNEKGADILIRALALLRDQGCTLKLHLCGDGPDRSRLEALTSCLGLSDAVSFTGWTAPDLLGQYYARASVVVIPSRHETFGIVALEAIAAGVSVVASNVDGLPESVGPCGVLVPPDDPAALARGILEALKPERDVVFRAAAPAHLERHQIDRVAEEYLDVFNSVARL